MRIRKALWLAAALLTLGSAACDETPVTLPQASEVTVAAPDLRLTVGDVAPVAAQVLDQQGHVVQGVTPTFVSDNPAVATVDAGGMVRAVSPGTANVKAAYGSASATTKVTVGRDERGFVQTLDVLADSLAVDVRAGTQALSLRAFNGYGQSVCPAVTVRSSDPLVVTATSAGGCRLNVTPQFAGVATLTFSSDAGRDSVRVRVTSNAAVAFVFTRPAAAQLFAGNTVTYAVRVVDAAGNPLANRAVSFDASAGGLSATHGTTDATGTVAVQWTLPTNLRAFGSTQTLFFRTVLPNGLVGGGNETVVVNGAPPVSLSLYRSNGSEYVPITDASFSARVYQTVYLGVSALDQYGNPVSERFDLAATSPAYTCGNSGFPSTFASTCVYTYTLGTVTFTATALSNGLSKSVDIVFTL